MKRRDFISKSMLTALTGTLVTPRLLAGSGPNLGSSSGKARNIIFMVSDGMSSGTLNMADLLLRRKEGRGSTWMDLYRQNRISRALMDTASADLSVTDSAAASSAWGGGRRVNNAMININPDGTFNKPILQKFRDAGKAVGCVTTTPITHATPAGFSVNMKHRDMQDRIASEYLKLKFNVMMGGGLEYFNGKKRKDKRNIFGDFKTAGFQVVRNKAEMENAHPGTPVLGVFTEDGLPYALDHESHPFHKLTIPSLADMTRKALGLMAGHTEGFVLQVEGGKVDWGAHGNDTPATLYDQIAFDEAVRVAIRFAEGRDDTLVIITTDHGNSNPGLIYDEQADRMFDTLQHVRNTNAWVLYRTTRNDPPSRFIERLNHAQGIAITQDEARSILRVYDRLENFGTYDPHDLPFEQLATIQQRFTSVHWSGMHHSSDFVELAMFGPGSEVLPPFVMNYELHNFMLEAAGIAGLVRYAA